VKIILFTIWAGMQVVIGSRPIGRVIWVSMQTVKVGRKYYKSSHYAGMAE
jgi:hypothetical protein